MYIKTIILHIFLLCFLYAEDQILLLNGDRLNAKIIEITDNELSYTIETDTVNTTITIIKDSVKHIRFSNGKKESFTYSLDAQKLRSNEYNYGFSIAATMGPLIAFNTFSVNLQLKVGYHSKHLFWGIRGQNTVSPQDGSALGGAVESVYEFHFGNFITLGLGASIGGFYTKENPYNEEIAEVTNSYFALGPQINFRVGYKHFYFVIENPIMVGFSDKDNDLFFFPSGGLEVIF